MIGEFFIFILKGFGGATGFCKKEKIKKSLQSHDQMFRLLKLGAWGGGRTKKLMSGDSSGINLYVVFFCLCVVVLTDAKK